VIKLNLHKTYRARKDYVSFHFQANLKENQIVGIYGKSGVGKSTLLRMMSGLSEPDEGELAIGNQQWYNSSNKLNLKAQKRSVGFLFQDYALFPNMTVRKNIFYGVEQEQDKSFIQRLIKISELEDILNKYPSELSGGQQQRVALVRALARKPRILLLDEPLSALDEELRDKLQNEILEVKKILDITIIFISHSKTEVLKLADEILVLEDRKVKFQGTPLEWFKKTSKPQKGVIVEVGDNNKTFKILVNGELVEVELPNPSIFEK